MDNTMKPPLVVIARLALLRGLLADPAPSVTRLAMAAAPIVGPVMMRTTILTLDAGRALDLVEVDGFGSLCLGRGPATLCHLDLHDRVRSCWP